MSKVFIYNHEKKQVDEKPTMKKPDWKGKTYMGFPYITGEAAWQSYKEACSEYEYHLASLAYYSTQNFPAKWNGKELVEGKDFELKDCFAKGNYENKCIYCGLLYQWSDALWFVCQKCSIFAVPLSSKSTEQDDTVGGIKNNQPFEIMKFPGEGGSWIANNGGY